MASELSMNGRKKIETLQKEFTQKFPYLTLIFLEKNRQSIDISKSLSEVRQAKGADISIIASLKVNTLEKRFIENFGLIVEVAYKKGGKIVYTKDNVDKTLNELNKWCESHDCEPFEFKKSLTGDTIKSIQEQLFASIKNYYPDSEAKKINKDNYLDIYVPEINKKRGTHLFFNTAKDGIKIGFYCRDEEFLAEVLSRSTSIEKYSQGLRILENPSQNNIDEAIKNALIFIQEIIGKKDKIKTNPNSKISNENLTENSVNQNFIKINISGPGSEICMGLIDKKELQKFITFLRNSNYDTISEAWLTFLDEIGKGYWDFNEISNLVGVLLDELEITVYNKENEVIYNTKYVDIDLEIGDISWKDSNINDSNKYGVYFNKKVEDILVMYKSNEYFSFDFIIPDTSTFSIEKMSFIYACTDEVAFGNDFGDYTSSFKYDDQVYTATDFGQNNLEYVVKFISGMNQSELNIRTLLNIDNENDKESKADEVDLTNFDITKKTDIDRICNQIESGKYITNLLYVNIALDSLGFIIDKHQAYFFDSNVLISDRELEGFLVVNMDGFYSNCMDANDLTPIFSWSGINDIQYTESKNNCSIDIISDEGSLTIKKIGTHSLKILFSFYKNVWKIINESFKDRSYIEWSEVKNMGFNELGFGSFSEYCNFENEFIKQFSEEFEEAVNVEIDDEDEVVLWYPQNGTELIMCLYILSYYYLSLNDNQQCFDNFQSEFKELFQIKNFSNENNGIIKEIKNHFENSSIDNIIDAGISKANSIYENKYQTHNDFLADIHNYISYLDLIDDPVFQSKYLQFNINLGNSLSEISNSGLQIRPQDRYLVVQIALSNWYNIKENGFDIKNLLSGVKYNLPSGNLLKYAILDEELSLMEKTSLLLYNIILLDEEGLEIKNKDIFKAKQLIADLFGFEITIDGTNVATMLRGSLNKSSEDDLGRLIGGFENNFSFDVMHFYNCQFAINRFRNRCIDLFKESYNEINETTSGNIVESIENSQFDSEDQREDKILSQYINSIFEEN